MRSWPGKFVLACGTISLLAQVSPAQSAAAPQPAIALVDSTDAAQWQTWTQGTGWHILAPSAGPEATIDARIEALEKLIDEAIQTGGVDRKRIYLAGRGGSSAAVFYAISQRPDLWAAAVAVGGSPRAAIDSGRLYAANFTNVPVLWIASAAEDAATAEKLRAAGLPLEWRSGSAAKIGEILEWLSAHSRADYPSNLDCETNSPAFASCYWIQMTKFDPAERNEVLDSTRIAPTDTAALDLGGFGFKPGDPGPGVLVSYLPKGYSGKLKPGDRLVALDGRKIADAQEYVQTMAQVKEERPATVMVERGKEHIRIETRIVLPQRPVRLTARVQARYVAAEDEVQIISRVVTGMRVTIPAQWTPLLLNWNGVPLEKIEAGGCRLLTIDKGLENAGPCP